MMCQRAWLAPILVGSLGATLAAFLVAPSARLPEKTTFVPKALRAQPVAVPLLRAEGRRGVSVHRTDLYASAPKELLTHAEIHVFLSPADARPRRAELLVVGTPCRYVAEGGTAFVEGEVTLRRGSVCGPASGGLPAGQLVLTVELTGAGELAIWSFVPDAGAADSALVRVASTSEDAPLLRGFFVDYLPTAPRLDLLSYMWQVAPGRRPLLVLLGTAGTLALVGVVVFPMSRHSPEGGPPPFPFALRSATGAACLAGALGLLYAVIAPPLSGPDEPYHLLGFAELNGRASMREDIERWMKLTHFYRTRQHPTERFRPKDVGHPFDTDDPEFRATEVAMRSASTAVLWRLAGRVLPDQDAPRTLLSVRVLNACFFGVVVGIGTGLAVACAPVPYPQLLCLPFLFVPTLPFFAMHFSETALLTATYVLLATSLAVMFLDGPRGHWAGFPLGLSTALMLAGGRSPWPSAAIVAAALAARVLLGSARREGEARSAVVFWAGFALGGSAFYPLLNDEYRAMLVVYTGFAPARLRSIATWLIQHPAGVLGLAALAAIAEIGLRPLRRALAGADGGRAGIAVRWASLGLVGAVVLSLLGSLFLPYPHLEREPAQPLSRGDLVVQTLATMATMFRLRDPDFLLSTSFWGAFGWLDTVPAPALVSALVLLTAACLVSLLLHLGRHREVRRFLWLLALGLGAALALVITALSIIGLPVVLHGRYFIGWYLPVLSVIASGAALAELPKAETAHGLPAVLFRVPRPAALLALCGLLHTFCLCFILWRYF